MHFLLLTIFVPLLSATDSLPTFSLGKADGPRDVVFLVDDTEAVSNFEFARALDFVAKTGVKMLSDPNDDTRVALVGFGIGARVHHELTSNSQIFTGALNTLSTNRAKAHVARLDVAALVVSKLLIAENNRSKHLIILTEIECSIPAGNPQSVKESFDRLRHIGVRIRAVFVDAKLTDEEVKCKENAEKFYEKLLGIDDRIYTLSEFDKLLHGVLSDDGQPADPCRDPLCVYASKDNCTALPVADDQDDCASARTVNCTKMHCESVCEKLLQQGGNCTRYCNDTSTDPRCYACRHCRQFRNTAGRGKQGRHEHQEDAVMPVWLPVLGVLLLIFLVVTCLVCYVARKSSRKRKRLAQITFTTGGDRATGKKRKIRFRLRRGRIFVDKGEKSGSISTGSRSDSSSSMRSITEVVTISRAKAKKAKSKNGTSKNEPRNH